MCAIKGNLRACHVRACLGADPADSYVAATGESVDTTLVHAVCKAIGAEGEHA
jgi:hypothetical protein